jgi:hypothetical protein
MAAMCFIPMLLKDRKDSKQAAASGEVMSGDGDGGFAGMVSSRTFWMAAGELALWNLGAQVGPGWCCPTRHSTHSDPSSLESTGTL